MSDVSVIILNTSANYRALEELNGSLKAYFSSNLEKYAGKSKWEVSPADLGISGISLWVEYKRKVIELQLHVDIKWQFDYKISGASEGFVIYPKVKSSSKKSSCSILRIDLTDLYAFGDKYVEMDRRFFKKCFGISSEDRVDYILAASTM